MINYKPKPRIEEVNVSKHSQLRQCFILLLSSAVFFFMAYVVAGVAVDALAGYVPPSWERRMGTMVSNQFPLHKTHPKAQKLQDLLRSLTPYLDEEDCRLEYSVSISKLDTVNAVALPGGRIVFFAGLLEKLETDEEILFVIAHELGHFHHRDHLRMQGRGLLYILMYSMIFNSGDELSGSAMNGISDSMEYAYSRSQECNADLFAVDLLYKATGSAKGAVAFMKKLEQMKSDTELLYFFSTHPSPANRRQYIEEAAKRF